MSEFQRGVGATGTEREKVVKIPKSVTGIGLILVGAGVHFIPAIGPIAGPYICMAGVGMLGVGTVDKVMRYKKGEDILANEKALLTKMKGK